MCLSTASGVADDVIDLFLSASSQTPGALNTGIQIDSDGRVTEISAGIFSGLKPRLA
jgi:hypothetical protein